MSTPDPRRGDEPGDPTITPAPPKPDTDTDTDTTEPAGERHPTPDANRPTPDTGDQ